MTRSVSPFERYGYSAPIEDQDMMQHVFVSGETLSGLAQRYYDDFRFWRVIADRNAVKDPRRIPVGTVLLIPPRPLERGNESF